MAAESFGYMIDINVRRPPGAEGGSIVENACPQVPPHAVRNLL